MKNAAPSGIQTVDSARRSMKGSVLSVADAPFEPGSIPFSILPAFGPPSRVVFASPHSGRSRPADMRHAAGMDEVSLRSAEDALVNELLADAPGLGAPVICGLISRAYVDLNRAAADLDPELIADVPTAGHGDAGAAKVAAGYGVIARRAGDGSPLYDRKLAWTEAETRLARVHAPYHDALSDLIGAARSRGPALLVDWHSMPSRAAGATPGRRGVDVVIGDRHGSACSAEVSRTLRAAFETAGWTVALNRPYAGGYTTQTWGRPDTGIEAVQIELNRALYLDEATFRPAPGFTRCRSVVRDATARLVGLFPG